MYFQSIILKHLAKDLYDLTVDDTFCRMAEPPGFFIHCCVPPQSSHGYLSPYLYQDEGNILKGPNYEFLKSLITEYFVSSIYFFLDYSLPSDRIH